MRAVNRQFQKWCFYSAFALFLLGLETAVFSRLPVMGAFPLLAPCFVAGVAVWEGADSSAIFALCFGVVTDCLHGTAGLYTISLTVLATAISQFSKTALRQSYFTSLVLTAACLLVCGLVRWLTAGGRFGVSALWTVMLPEFGYSLIIAVPALLVIYAIHGSTTSGY